MAEQSHTDQLNILIVWHLAKNGCYLLVSNIPHVGTESRVPTPGHQNVVLGPHILVEHFTQLRVFPIPAGEARLLDCYTVPIQS